jgi:hypothetical protein
MDNEKFNLFLRRLLEKTESGQLEWEKTADRDTLLLVLEDSAVSLTKVAGNYFSFDFRNELGDVVENYTVSILKDEKDKIEKTEKLYQLARQQTFKYDKTVDRILEQLAA